MAKTPEKTPEKTPTTAKPHRTPSGRPSRARIIEADQPSACFVELYYEGGIATATFAKDGTTYDYPMSRSEFREWADDESLGGFFNLFVR